MGAGIVRLDRTDETDECRAWDGSPLEDETRDDDGLLAFAEAAMGDTGRDLLDGAGLDSCEDAPMRGRFAVPAPVPLSVLWLLTLLLLLCEAAVPRINEGMSLSPTGLLCSCRRSDLRDGSVLRDDSRLSLPIRAAEGCPDVSPESDVMLGFAPRRGCPLGSVREETQPLEGATAEEGLLETTVAVDALKKSRAFSCACAPSSSCV